VWSDGWHRPQRSQRVEARKLLCPGRGQSNRSERESADLSNEVPMSAAAEALNVAVPLGHGRRIEWFRLALENSERMQDRLPGDRSALVGRAGDDHLLGTSDADPIQLSDLSERLLIGS